MGAWGVCALENDEALDYLCDGATRLLNKSSVSSLLHSEDTNWQTLGVATVVATSVGASESVFGFIHEEYIPVLTQLPTKDYHALVPDALKCIPYLRQFLPYWVADAQYAREKYLNMLEACLLEMQQ